MSKSDIIKFALLQLNIVHDKKQNVENAIKNIRKVVKEQNAKVIVLAESFNCPFGTQYFAEYAENVPNGYTCQQLSAIAKELDIYVIGGSIFEKNEKTGKIHNTTTVWSPKGELMGIYRKIHPFDADIKGQITFKETSVVTPGNDFLIVTIENRKFGIAICNDYRFDELAKIYRKEGVDGIIYTFVIPTCQSQYFEPLLKARAADNQVFVVAVSCARDEKESFIAYGHSMVVSPWAKILCEASEKEECLVCDVDFSGLEKLREDVPLFKQRRTDLYDTIKKK